MEQRRRRGWRGSARDFFAFHWIVLVAWLGGGLTTIWSTFAPPKYQLGQLLDVEPHHLLASVLVLFVALSFVAFHRMREAVLTETEALEEKLEREVDPARRRLYRLAENVCLHANRVAGYMASGKSRDTIKGTAIYLEFFELFTKLDRMLQDAPPPLHERYGTPVAELRQKLFLPLKPEALHNHLLRITTAVADLTREDREWDEAAYRDD